jgi:uncharacterized protein
MTDGKDPLRYDRMVENALRGVAREALGYVQRHGLPGEHHFYITYRTDHPGVLLSQHLRARYANEITIVLQHQFWNLEVGEESFRVTVSFGDKPEAIVVPYAAITAFVDPSVRFGLQFQPEGSAAGFVSDAETKQADPPPDATPAPEAKQAPTEAPAKVVTLDAFRKK